MKFRLTLFILLSAITYQSQAQIGIFKKKETPADTQYHVYLDTVNIEARSLRNYNFNRYAYIVAKMYPIADTAIMLMQEVELNTMDMKKRESKKYRKQLEKDLKEKFEDRLKNFSRTEGTVLIKIIERNTGRTMYDILRETKNKGTAIWWQSLGKFYGYNLQDGYSVDANPMLEIIIHEYEVKHNIVE